MTMLASTEFEKYVARQVAKKALVTFNQMIFCNIPSLSEDNLSEHLTMPHESQIVHRTDINRAGYIDENKVVYSAMLGTNIGDFEFNYIALINKEENILAVACFTDTIRKRKNKGRTYGNSLSRNMILQFSGAKELTGINVSAESWQVDFTSEFLAIHAKINRLSDPDGFKHIGQVESIAQLRTIEPTEDQQRILVKSYYAGKNLGGGVFYADFNDTQTADNGWEVIVTNNGQRWKLIKNQAKSLSNKRVKMDVPLVFDGYESELDKAGYTDVTGYIYPGSFAIDEKANELVILYGGSWDNAPMYLVARDFDTGEQKWYAKLNIQSVGEGLSINYDYGSRKAFIAGRQDGFLNEFDLSNITSGAMLDITASYNVGVYNQFSYDNGIWAFERNAPFIAGYIARNTIDFYDKNFNLLNSTSLPIWSSGYVTKTTNDYAKYLHKRQGFALKGDKLFCAFGGAHDNNTPAVCTEYQGTKIFNLAGDCLEETMLEPIAMRRILTKHLGKQSELRRIENEGIVVTSKGEVYTLYIYHSRATPFEIRKKEGIVIFQELTDAGDCVDYSEAVTYTAQPDFMSLRRMPRGVSGKMIDPLTGREITQMSDIFKFVRELNIPDLMFDTGGFTKITDIDGEILGSGLIIRVINQNTVMYVEITNRNHATLPNLPSSYAATLSSDGRVWSKNKCDLSIGGDIVFGKDSDGKSTILARISTKNFTKGKNVLLADVQSGTSNNNAFIGGGSSVYEGVNQIRFFTAENKGDIGTARWAILNSGHFIPWGNGLYDLGAKNNRIKNIYSRELSIAKDDNSQALIRLANALREITINISASGNAGIWDNNLTKWLLVAGNDGVLKVGTTPAIDAMANELITAGWFKSQFSQSLSQNGWQRLPSGLIIQWGTYNANTESTFRFPIAFTQSCFVVIPVDYNTTGGNIVDITGVNKTAESFQILTQGGDVGAFSVVAIGV
ncbi:hypothetical protein EIM44_04775 [Bibersteinia trehalosi]|uniref:Phage tail protein n=1 Tax=Bibersteinia trehalosi TaxID=47735 RepID=A0A3R8LCG3_BIBTR|nr:phage tail protein [Bibersteinia trehalosi]RRN04755.1 hypothetical protein EIM44_04775 [Bibersteinia trehalosi]